jgi:hypothetical protein
MQLRASPVPHNGCRLISNINQGTEFLSKEQQQQANSAIVMASLKEKRILKDLKNQDKQRKGEKLERETPKKTKPERRDKQDIGTIIRGHGPC